MKSFLVAPHLCLQKTRRSSWMQNRHGESHGVKRWSQGSLCMESPIQEGKAIVVMVTTLP